MVLVLSVGMMVVPGSVKADPSPDYRRIIVDPNEGSIPDAKDLEEIYAAFENDTLYFKVVTYQDWNDPLSDIDVGIFLDVDQDAGTGGTDATLGYPEGVHGIGADYVAVVGYEGVAVWPWVGPGWGSGSTIDYAYTDVQNNTNTFEIGIDCSDIGSPAAIDIVAVSAGGEVWDYAPDEDYVSYTLAEGPKADFSAEPPMGEAPLTVQFTDLSRGDIDRDGYFWSFGDGETSTERDTTHTYQNEGIYDVSLTVTGPGGTDSASGQVIVEGAATIAKLVVRNLNITPAYVYPRQAVTVSANVVNEGGGWGSETVDLMINGYVEQSRGVGVSPGTAYPVSFTVYEVPAGEYQVTIGDATGVFYVMEEAAAAPSGGILPAGELSSGSIVAIIVIGIIVIGGVVVVVMFAGGRR